MVVVVPSDYLVSTKLQLWLFCCWGCGCCWAVTIAVEPRIGVSFGRKIVLWLGCGIHSKFDWVGVIILEKIVLGLRLWSYQLIKLFCGCVVWIQKIGLGL